jgi:cobalt transporter subunit CbtB
VEGKKGDQMATSSTKPGSGSRTAAELTTARAVPIFMAALLGIFIVGGVGFSHIEAVHNAAHDYRHSMAFPCH